MNRKRTITISVIMILVATVSCVVFSPERELTPIPPPAQPTATPTPLPPSPVQAGEGNLDEPVFIRGSIPYTSPFFVNSLSEPFVLLEDEAGFVMRDKEFEFPLAGQAIGPVEIHEDETLTYTLALPAIPQGTLVDVDNDGQEDMGVMVFAVAYWSNTWGGPFLEPRDGVGWSSAYTSTIVDPEREDEIIAGTLLIWAPDEDQEFPSGFGPDGLLFTSDDPAVSVPPGYSIVDLNQEPFNISKKAEPVIDLIEGESAVKDYSEMSYQEAFDTLFEKVSHEYPFTDDKGVNWQLLYDTYAPQVAAARDDDQFYRAIRAFTYAIPDAHIGVSFNSRVFFEEQGGSFGLVLKELSDGRVIVTKVLENTTGSRAGIQIGAEIITWDGEAVTAALAEVTPYFSPFSTEHHAQQERAIYLTRYPPDTVIEISYRNPDDDQIHVTELTAEVEYDSLFASIPSFTLDEMVLPLQGEVLDESGLGYILITTFSDDYNLMARLWERFIQTLVDLEIPGLIIDMRINGGGSGGLASDFAGYFFSDEFVVAQWSYYNEISGEFEDLELPSRIKPGPFTYDGHIAVLVSPHCISACEGFTNALTHDDRAIVVGHFPTAGAYGSVGLGQYSLPGEIDLQFPTGRSETPDGDLLIEGVGVPLDITVPVTVESALGLEDAVLDAAIQALLAEINN